jgi:uncharacterized phage protein gp47/JayE
MNGPMNGTMNKENCDCCEGTEPLTPEPTANRPGLDALAYRVGTHATFLESMKAGLSSSELPALRALTTRETSDPALALLDAGATMLDILTFYQERIANEGYLRTATERRSILELARLVGYTLRPGVAASVFLAFTLENGYKTEIPTGIRSQSIPAPGEFPQSFETSEPLPARAEWNNLQPRMTRPMYITLGNAPLLETLYFKGISTNLKPNDPLLLVFGMGPDAQVLHRVETVEALFAEDRTTVILQAAALHANAAALRATRMTVEKYLALETFPVSGKTQMARRVTGFLTQFQQQLVPGLTASELIFRLDTLLPELREEHAIAVEGKYEQLEPWMRGLVSDLEGIATLTRETPTRAGLSTLSASGTPIRTGNSTLTGLGRLIPSLIRPPSLQPRNTHRLPRDFHAVFGPQSDTLPRLLTAFQPQLKDTLYHAWGNAQVTPQTALDSLHAFRVQAAPFGHNAPLRNILDEKGGIVGQEQWPLANARRIELSFIVDSPIAAGESFLGINQVQITHFINGQIHKKIVPIPLVEENFLIGDLEVYIKKQPDTIELDFLGGNLVPRNGLQSIVLHRNENSLTIQFGGGDIELQWGEFKQIVLVDSHRVTVVTQNISEAGEFSGELISIRDEFPPASLNLLTLDAEYSQIKPNSWVAVQRGDEKTPRIFQVKEAKTVSSPAYGLSGKATELTLSGDWLNGSGTATDWTAEILQKTTVFAQSEPLALAEEPIFDDISGRTIELGALYDGLESGRWAIVSGERTDIPNTNGVKASELVMLTGVTQGVSQVDAGGGQLVDLPGDKMHTTLALANALAYTYKRDTVILYGNVVKATHGETRQEILGSGNTSKKFQTFGLKQFPLTFVSAPTPSGLESTLSVRVNDVRWPEGDGLVWLDTNDRGYETKTDDYAKTAIVFGDGAHGARLPTGPENIKTTYRFGIGKPGNVTAEQISLLASRPLGLKGVINPLPATGGADRENRDQARKNVPLALMALDRLVSVKDYADFARTFAGIGKATAVELSDGRRTLVHVTVAGVGDIPIDPTSDVFLNLRQALHKFSGDPFLPVVLDVRKRKVLVMVARVRLLADFAWEFVEPALRAALLDTFSFARRELGQDVTSSEVLAAMQAVEGVAYVDLEVLDAVDEDTSLETLANLADTLSLHDRIPVALAHVAPTLFTLPRPILPAQIAYLNPDIPDTLILSELTL